MGLFARARSLSRPGKSTGGLLQRSRILLENLIRIAPAREPLASAPVPQDLFAPFGTFAGHEPRLPNSDELGYRIASIPDGFAAPTLLFRLLVEQLGLKSAALLFLDVDRRVYAPWAAVGLDTTTLHRLRISPGANEAFNRAASGEVILVTGAELSSFRELFSTREFAALKEMALVPFVCSQRLAGLLMITRSAFAFSGELVGLLREASHQAAALIYKAREKAEKPSSDEEPKRQEAPLAEEIESLLRSCRSKSNPLILMRISLQELIDLVRKTHPELEPFRLSEDLRAQCASLFRVIGRVQIYRRQHLLLAIHGMREADPALILYQLEAFLRSFLKGLIDSPSVTLLHDERIVSDDPQAALAFLAEYR